MDFLTIGRRRRNGCVEIYPKFIVYSSSGVSKDLMIRGHDFYAVWVEDRGLWSTNEFDALRAIDEELRRASEEERKKFDLEAPIKVLYMWDSESGMIDSWHKFCQKQLRDNYVPLDETLIFSNSECKKEDYASKKLPYPLEPCLTPAYDKLIGTLYSEEERHKLEWAIGAIISGDSKDIQKFMVLYGAAGTGKSTILNIIQMLFEGYYSIFDAKALGSSSNSFALEPFKTNPLVAIQHDGDLSKIEDNTRLNSLVSHELMTVNEKFKSLYTSRFNCFLFMGTNKPVKITDAKSGLIRRLIDVTPSGEKLSASDYRKAMKQVRFELGGIASHCLDVYSKNPSYYDDYIPTKMMGASNDFYNFVFDSYMIFKKEDGTSLSSAWEMYKQYCEEAKVGYVLTKRVFKEELKNYFNEFHDSLTLENGTKVRSYFRGFDISRFETDTEKPKKQEKKEEALPSFLQLKVQKSMLDEELGDCPAQYANDSGKPTKTWDRVSMKLSSIDTSRLHYVKPPSHHIFVDFDLKNSAGEKSLEMNLEAAKSWPPTYAEVSKGGQGLHLHYIYTGDPEQLSRIFDEGIEIKAAIGNSSIRRKLTLCNNEPIRTISSGLPLRSENKKVVSIDNVKSEKTLRVMILRNLNKEYHSYTAPSVNFIKKILDDAYASGLKYDVTDMRPQIFAFAANSSNQAKTCTALVREMKFKSDEPNEYISNPEAPIVFFDIECFPNLFVICWKYQGKDKKVVPMINPTPKDIEPLLKCRLIGFNNRNYDNHMVYAAYLGKSNEELYTISQRIIENSPNSKFSEAYNLSYTDILDFSSEKQSLKKFEIELGIHHQELGLPWDQPVPESMWETVVEYCCNDVIATEAVFDSPARQADFTARKILADVAGMSVNDTTNSLTTRIIFGKNRKPQSAFNYRFMGDVPRGADKVVLTKDGTLYTDVGDDYVLFDDLDRPVFPGYKFEHGVSTYRGETVGEGGYVYAEPGIHYNVALLDVASMHPSSAIAEVLFGEEYTKVYNDILQMRIAIKHKDFEYAKTLMGGKLARYLEDEKMADDLAQALKIAINSVYGLTSAKFENAFRDPRNVDNIVAKRGALFMINLKHEVQARGFTVAHIKTDSIKIPNATPEIIQFVVDFGKMYGYNFEHEAMYDRMCLVNNAVYIAKYATIDQCVALYGEEYAYKSKDTFKDNKKHGGEWTATGKQFAVPYIFKTLFSKEPIVFEDMCETNSVTSAIYLDMNEGLPNVEEEELELSKRKSNAALSGTGKTKRLNPRFSDISDEDLEKRVSEGHNYIFVGKVGQFCPMKPGTGGGILVRQGKGKYDSISGAKAYRWLESECVRTLGKEDDIDKTYYNEMVNEAYSAIDKYGDAEMFINERMAAAPPWFSAGEPWSSPTQFDIR